MSNQNDLDAQLYELNCANAAWHESTGREITRAHTRFQKALQWFKDRNIGVHTIDDATHRGIYVIEEENT